MMQAKRLWYTRRDGLVRGPFPTGLVSRYILLGRVHEGDELSVDMEEWGPLSAFPHLIPSILREPADQADEDERLQRLKDARRWADERSGMDRRDRAKGAGEFARQRRRFSDRRQPEPVEVIQHRLTKVHLRSVAAPRRERYLPQLLIALVLLGGVGLLAYYYPNTTPAPASECQAPPRPGVNWSNCALEGAALSAQDLHGAILRNANLGGADLRRTQMPGNDLSYSNLNFSDLSDAELSRANMKGANLRNANLTNAHLSGADLSYADLTGANPEGADFTDVNLENAIWIDQTLCGPGSIGQCLPIR
jgi:hypothetical protein